jgi:hypothetical protein
LFHSTIAGCRTLQGAEEGDPRASDGTRGAAPALVGIRNQLQGGRKDDAAPLRGAEDH